jgi:hypothetical protein
MLEERYGMLYTTPRPEVKALSGPDGSFRFSISPSEAASENFDPANVVAMGPAVPSDRGDAGYGLAFERAWAFDASGKLAQRLASAQPDRAGFLAEKQEKVLRLVKDDFPLVGRIVNGKGQPVVGATVGVRELWLLHNDDLPGFLNAVQKENADYDRARAKYRSNQVGALLAEQGLKYLLTATGNHDGRFRLTGIGRDRIVGLLIEGPGIQPDLVYAYTRPGPTLRIEHEYHS